MYYKKLGRLPISIVDKLKDMIMIRRDQRNTNDFQRIEFDETTVEYLRTVIQTDLKVQRSIDNTHWVQKAFYSQPNFVYPIHRDGVKCRSALNIILECNPEDWVRWYDTSVVDRETFRYNLINEPNIVSSRETVIDKNVIESMPYLDEFKGQVGDVYIVDVDTYHTWKCAGPNHRVVIQTKFDKFPSFENLVKSFENFTLKNL